MTSTQPQSIPKTTPTIQTKSALLLIQKLKQLRQQYTLYGYSQLEFQTYFINNLLEQDLDNIKDTSQYLTIKIKEINSKQKMEKILGKVDLQLGGIFCQQIIMEELSSKNQNEGKVNEIVAKRKMSKDYRQSKKDKKTKAQRHKKQKKIDKTQLTQNQDDNISLLKDRTKDLINILISQKPSNLLQKSQNPLNNIFKPSNPPYNIFSSSRNQELDEQNQNQRIFQKLIEIQMLSKLLCSGQRENESCQSFMMRCL